LIQKRGLQNVRTIRMPARCATILYSAKDPVAVRLSAQTLLRKLASETSIGPIRVMLMQNSETSLSDLHKAQPNLRSRSFNGYQALVDANPSPFDGDVLLLGAPGQHEEYFPVYVMERVAPSGRHRDGLARIICGHFEGWVLESFIAPYDESLRRISVGKRLAMSQNQPEPSSDRSSSLDDLRHDVRYPIAYVRR